MKAGRRTIRIQLCWKLALLVGNYIGVPKKSKQGIPCYGHTRLLLNIIAAFVLSCVTGKLFYFGIAILVPSASILNIGYGRIN